MAKKLRYRAISVGVLSKPYRVVKVGEILEFDEPVDWKWLQPADKPVVIPPITSAMPKSLSPIKAMNAKPAAGQNPAYEQHISRIIEAEKAQDAKALQAKENQGLGKVGVADAAPSAEAKPQGTGNKEVL